MLESRPQEHTTCVTEHDKYAKGATKPGGFAAGGFYGSGKTAAEDGQAAAAGLEFLSSQPPWKCNICNVSCTSRETLLGHATGAKHKRRVRLKHHPASNPGSALCGAAQWFCSPAAPGRMDCAEICAERYPSAKILAESCGEPQMPCVMSPRCASGGRMSDLCMVHMQAKAASRSADTASKDSAGADVTAAPVGGPGVAQDEQPLHASKTASGQEPDASTKKSKPKRKAEDAAAISSAAAGSTETAENGKQEKKSKKRKLHGLKALPDAHAAGAGKLQSASACFPNGQLAAGKSRAALADKQSAAAASRAGGRKQRQEQVAHAPEMDAHASVGGADHASKSQAPNWSKLARQVLQGCEGERMKATKLQRKVLAAAGLPKEALAQHQQAIAQKIGSRKKTFRVHGDLVSLRAPRPK